MGLLGEGINEVIATTWGNAAPMGIIFRDGVYRMVLYRGSHTAMNIERWGWVVANIVHDPVLWVRTAFSDLPPSSFAEENVEGFRLTRKSADLLHASGCGREAIVKAFLRLLSEETDTFIVKEHGQEVAGEVRERAAAVLAGREDLAHLDAECISRGINPGSTADVIIAGIYVALGEGWEWDCSGKG